ncbi:MAG: transcriptional regulator, Crp/Fnr family [Marmoricola sp.]|nr:transcriptional regulator, Crp/Fnr family [Marmoricola sp.]
MHWSLLAPLDEDERQAVIAAARKRSFAKGETVFHEGAPSDSMHLVVAGHLAVTVSTPDGDRATLNVVGPGGWFGELTLLRGQSETTRSATVTALDACETLVLSQAEYHELCDRYPSAERLVVALMAERIRELSAQLLQARYVSLDRRLYQCLLDLAEVYPASGGLTVLPLTQDQLAEMVGSARPSVNQVLQLLAAAGIVELGRGRIVLLDRTALAEKAGL